MIHCRMFLASAAGLLLWAVATAGAQEGPAADGVSAGNVPDLPAAENAELIRLVDQLDGDSYWTRESAMRRLSEAGGAAVAPLATAAEGESFEAICRAVQVLREISLADDLAAAESARQALEKVAASPG